MTEVLAWIFILLYVTITGDVELFVDVALTETKCDEALAEKLAKPPDGGTILADSKCTLVRMERRGGRP